MARPVRNWFAQADVSARYAAGRPDVHGPVADRIAARVGRGRALERAADIGCGTGLSLRAIARHATRAVGVDPSRPMLAEARRNGAEVACGRAEQLPLASASCDLMTIACAWHWCDADAFLAEAARVLRPGGWLVVYDSQFRGSPEDPRLLEWLMEHYWGRLSWVDRNPGFAPDRHRHGAFTSRGHEDLAVLAPMTSAEVRTLVTSQASTVANIDRGVLTLADAEARLEAGLAPFWPDRDALREMRFASPIDFLERTA